MGSPGYSASDIPLVARTWRTEMICLAGLTTLRLLSPIMGCVSSVMAPLVLYRFRAGRQGIYEAQLQVRCPKLIECAQSVAQDVQDDIQNSQGTSSAPLIRRKHFDTHNDTSSNCSSCYAVVRSSLYLGLQE
jgi:hypothetical protein